MAQGSSQTRNYSYDMLGRLTSAQIPEAGTTTYSYAVSGSPCSGNPSAPCSRTDARSVTTTYAYDALNRLLDGCKLFESQGEARPELYEYNLGNMHQPCDRYGLQLRPRGAHGELLAVQPLELR